MTDSPILDLASWSRRLLREICLSGEIVATSCHTEHCASLLLDNGAAFTGDLPPEKLAFDNPVALTGWKLLLGAVESHYEKSGYTQASHRRFVGIGNSPERAGAQGLARGAEAAAWLVAGALMRAAS
jgi:hypothetical protein